MTSWRGFVGLAATAFVAVAACSTGGGEVWVEPPRYVFSMNAYCDQSVHGRFIVTVADGDVTEAVPVERSAEEFLRTNGMQAVPTLADIAALAGDESDVTFDDEGVPSRVRADLPAGGEACFDILTFGIPLPDDVIRSIYAQTIDRTCAEAAPHGGCSGRVEVSERWDAGFGTSRLPMPDVVRATVEAELPEAVFTHADGAPEATLRLLIGPYEIVRDEVVRVEAGYVCGGLCGSGRVWYYRLTNGVWEPVTPGAVGEHDSRWEA